jgi:hypothetical protein
LNCTGFALLLASDEPRDRAAAAAHAAGCGACADRLRFQDRLAGEAAAWREVSAILPPALEGRVLAAARRARAAAPAPPVRSLVPRPRRRVPGRLPVWAALAAAAVFCFAMLGLSLRGPAPGTSSGGRILLVADALAAAEEAEHAHAAAIALLASAAEPVLARSSDPATPPRDAALLLAYRDRLRYLDRTIREIQGHLAHNAGNPTARALLLAAYSEKTDVLREVLALGEGLERGVS